MNATAIYVGDEVRAAGYRLAGARIVVPSPGAEEQALRDALGDAALVLLSADVAARIPQSLLRKAQAALAPLVLIVPGSRAAMPDVAERIRHQLGLEA